MLLIIPKLCMTTGKHKILTWWASLSTSMFVSINPCSLCAGLNRDVRCDAAVRDGPACLTLPGALHPDNLCCGGWVQERDEAVLGRYHLWGKTESSTDFWTDWRHGICWIWQCLFGAFNRFLCIPDSFYSVEHCVCADTALFQRLETQQCILARQMLTANN